MTEHAVLERSHEVLELRCQLLKSGIHNFNSSVIKYKQNIVFLGSKTIQRGRLFSWKEYIEHLKEERFDWLAILKVALEIYNGELRGYANVPDEKEVREVMLKKYMKELIKESIESVLLKFRQKDQKVVELLEGSEDSYQAYVIAIKVAIEFCLNISATDFLFSEIIAVFKNHGLWLKFI